MKTTVLISDEMYTILAQEAREKYGNRRSLSSMLNDILKNYFSKKKDMFGSSKPFDTSNFRDKTDRL